MAYFLIIYDRQAAHVRGDVRQFASSESEQALKERFRLESVERENPEIEVVLLEAESLEALKKTHSRYFKSTGELSAPSIFPTRR